MTQAEQIVASARKAIGTKWVHQGRSEDGLDCAGLVIKIGNELGLLDWDIKDYERKASMSAMLDICREHLTEIPRVALQPGDLVVLRFKDTNHIGIIGDYPHGGLSIIHAQATAPRRVGENRFCDDWMKLIGCRLAGCFRFPERVR
ncbi:C40 family peptidase [Xenophilus sp.]|uniref:C40 family peptidase n=1 Tax=Xenophilus sp. TaxID=1873499 RepID=UPI0037DCCEC9